MKKGISLIALVVTIIVLIIIVSAVMLSNHHNNTIEKAKESAFKQNITNFKEELLTYNLKKQTESLGTYDSSLLNADKNQIKYDNNVLEGNIITILPSLKNSIYEDYIKIENGEITFYGEDEQERQWATDIVKLGEIIRILSNEELSNKILTLSRHPDQTVVDPSTIGIDAWGKSVNLDLWTYSLSGTTGRLTYKGTIVNGKIVGEIPAYIKSNGVTYKMTDLTRAFKGLTTLVEGPYIPDTATTFLDAFYGCTGMTKAPIVPASAVTIQGIFWNCTKLNGTTVTINATSQILKTYAYALKYLSNVTLQGPDEALLSNIATTGSSNINVIYLKHVAKDSSGNTTDINKWRFILNSNGTASVGYVGSIVEGKIECKVPQTIVGEEKIYTVINMENAFKGITTLVEAPEIPNTVTSLYNGFYGCSSLTKAPVIPSSVTNLQGIFWNCTRLAGSTITVNSPAKTVTAYAFKNVSGVNLEGPVESVLSGLASTGTNITYTVK